MNDANEYEYEYERLKKLGYTEEQIEVVLGPISKLVFGALKAR